MVIHAHEDGILLVSAEVGWIEERGCHGLAFGVADGQELFRRQGKF